MDPRALKRWALRALVALAIGAGVWALLLLAHSAENSADFNRRQPWILLLNGCAALVLGVIVARRLLQLRRDFLDHAPGSRLTVRTVLMFGTLVVVPLLVVYLFAVEFLNYGIDTWFRGETRQGLNDALVLSRSALDLRLREQTRRTENFAHGIAALTGPDLAARLEAERREAQAAMIVVYDRSGRMLALSSEPGAPLPGALPREVLLQAGAGRPYASLLQPDAGGDTVRTAAAVPRSWRAPPGRILLVDYRVPPELTALANAVQAAWSRYGDLSATREPLKLNFILTLSLVLFITMLAAIYVAVWSAQRLVRPVGDLIAGTRAVGKGDFAMRLPLPSRDEMGYLVHSFNDMTKRLRRASDEARASRQAVERERERLAVILSRLSSGVLVCDAALNLRSANASAGSILGCDLALRTGSLAAAAAASGSRRLAAFVEALRARLDAGAREWREQLPLKDDSGECVLLWACTPLPAVDAEGALVIVFEDITALLTAQRSAAWGEVARRLAHEIKNPLTPIQLSAEQLRRKLHDGLDTERARMLERATRTIEQQVDAMKQMVNAFSEYARSPEMRLANFSLNQLAAEVVELYRLQDPSVQIRLEADPKLPDIEADRGRVRQILANLLSNGIEALAGSPGAAIGVRTRWLPGPQPGQAEITVSDNGPGFREDILQRAFEPYVTSKARGTGLGLAIVQRIVEEHGGRISAENLPGGGASVRVVLPALAGRRTELRRERA